MPIPRIAIATVSAFAATAAVAGASVLVYQNDFSNRSSFKELRKLEGKKKCGRFGRKQKAYGIEARRGPADCVFATPVEGDSKAPNHELEARARLLERTGKQVRSRAFVGVALRVDKSSHYRLRVFPATQRWELERRPAGEEFPLTGTDDAIKGINKVNNLKLRAFGDRLTAIVNNRKLVDDLADRGAGDLNGRRTALVMGSTKKSKQSAYASFDDVKVRVPEP